MSAISTTSVLEGMARALPTHTQGDDSSDLASSYEAIGLLLHSYLSELGFKLIGFHEDRPLAECQSLAPRLPASWNAGYGSLGFVYTHEQQPSDKTSYVFRVDKMGARVEIRGTASSSSSSSSSESNTIHRFDLAVRDVVQSSGLPVRITLDGEGRDNGNRQDLVETLRRVFVSDAAITSLIQDVSAKIVQNLLGTTATAATAAAAAVEARADDAADERRLREERFQQERQDLNRLFPGHAQPSAADIPAPRAGPLPEAARPRPSVPTGEFLPPGFDDEYDINRPPGGMTGGLAMPPLNIGHDDLHPPGLGPHDPLRGSGLPAGLGGGGFGGMHPSFDDPLFTGQGGRAGSGGGGGIDFDPQVPPGARYDPPGPGGDPVGPDGGPRRQQRYYGPQGGNPFGGSGHPFGGGGGII
ncbi:PI31 proteasome regulator [Cordyceps militaris]|uniref:PI31 proteasome regulator n=1 Tax=Cordyceps militaris TaxID=73501 RepID=A0A2H4SHQ1_CORMI|nr:PI31 proteasome regulator [Cordyceps militaris]